ncbi:MAG TPA: chitobiase/beta-hexosaminidase C-terminal domain-containing protein, partial [Nitrolancea sp.]|nr:chitobiase/beta-hexosaminidase C-terminal domain-containing protein [Nitrolancea sp.]
PTWLGQDLGSGYEVTNFGVSGTTMLKASSSSYWNTSNFTASSDYLPDIVIIMLGTNDSKISNWSASGPNYPGDYTDMIHHYQGLSSHPQVFVMTSPPNFTDGTNYQPTVIANQIVPTVRSLSVATGSELIDIFTTLTGHSELFSDGTHPTTTGSQLIASIVQNVLLTTLGSPRNGGTFEAESQAVADDTLDVCTVNSETGYSGGKGVQYSATAAADYVTLRVGNISAGLYDVVVGYKKHPSRAIVQLAGGTAGGSLTNIGSPIDEYAATSSYTSTDVGNWTATTSGDQDFKFAVTGHNASSTGYSVTIDYIKLTPVASYTITASAGAGGTLTPSGSVVVARGANQSFAIAANSGYAISDVSVDGASVGAVSSYTFGNVQANHTIRATFSGSGPTEINDTDAGIVYTGSWSYSSNRTHGEYQADVHFTGTNGDSVSYTFNGTGISYLTETNTDEGNVGFYIDGVLQQTVSCVSATRVAQVAVYTASGLTAGTHTLKAVKVDGTYMLIDALIITSSGSPVAAPTFTPGGGTYSSTQTVTIGTTTAGASIRYTVDGSSPSETSGTLYTGPVVVGSNTTLKAIAYKSGMSDSPVTSATYAFSVTLTAASGFYNQALPAAKTGTFTAQFDAISSVSPANALVGLSQGTAAAYTDIATAVRFNPSGDIDARNGGAFAAAATIPFTAGSSYHFRLVINVAAHTYSAYVTPAGGSEIAIGTNYAFRTEQAGVTQLDTWNADVNATPGGSLTVSNFVVQ